MFNSELSFKHPAYFGLAHTLPATDKRIETFKNQFNTQGFDDTYSWSLHSTIAKFVGKLLIDFSELSYSCPNNKKLNIWKKACFTHGQSLLAFTELSNYSLPEKELEKIYVKANKAMYFVADNFFDLWD